MNQKIWDGQPQTLSRAQLVALFPNLTDEQAASATFTVQSPPSGLVYSFNDAGDLTFTPPASLAPGECETATLGISITVEYSASNTLCDGTEQELTFVSATATSYAPGQGPEKAINGVIGADDAAGSSNWFASNGYTRWEGNLGGEQCIHRIVLHFIDSDQRQYERAVSIIDNDGTVVQVVAPRGYAELVDPSVGEVFEIDATTAPRVRVEGWGYKSGDTVVSWFIVGLIKAIGVQLNEPVLPKASDTIITAGMVLPNLAVQTPNERVWTAPIGEWQQSSSDPASWRPLFRPSGDLSDGDQGRSRHAYSTRRFYSPDGRFGISNGSEYRRVWTLDQAGVPNIQRTYPTHANWIRGTANHLAGLDRASGRVTVVDIQGNFIRQSDNVLHDQHSATWTVSGSSGDMSIGGQLVLQPLSAPNGEWRLVIVDVFSMQRQVVDLTNFPITGLVDGAKSYTIDFSALHPSGLFLTVSLRGPTGSDGDKHHVLRRSSPTASDWTHIGIMEASHGDYGYDYQGNPVWWGIGWDHGDFVQPARTGLFEWKLNDPSNVTCVIGSQAQYDNNPYSFVGHVSGLASTTMPGVALVSGSEPDGGVYVGLTRTDQIDRWHKIFEGPTIGSNGHYQIEPQASFSEDGRRCVVALRRQDQPLQPMLVEIDTSGYLAAA